jgi:hypothetical protein
MKELPIGIQDFADVCGRENNYLYIDKTEFIYKMTKKGKVYFLSRPRRFGKSLLVSTLQELFEGNKKLFKGLYIYDKWDWNKKFPVIRLDFGERAYETAQTLKISLIDFVNEIAEDFEIELKKNSLSDRFGELLKKLKTKTGQKIVILIDEYDKPMTDFLSKPKKADENRTVLHDFYQVLKANDKYLKFIFLTGVSKLSGVSVFSALNNPRDITRSDDFAAICGYTQEELETNFSAHIADIAKKEKLTKDQLLDKIKYWYNGYTWDGKTSVYNPFSTLSFFTEKFFSNYWISTGASISTEMLLKDYSLLEDLFKQITVNETFFDGFNLKNIRETSFLFQSGYLTIKKIKTIRRRRKFVLEIPNQEVKEALSQYMLLAYSTASEDDLDAFSDEIQEAILASDAAVLEKTLKSLFAQIPYNLHSDEEKYYHSIFFVVMLLIGCKMRAEVATNLGKIDAIWEQDDKTTVIEIKYGKDKSLEALIKEAMKQIKEKKYYEPYMRKPVSLLAIAFAAGKKEDRLTEIACKFEELNLSSPSSLRT